MIEKLKDVEARFEKIEAELSDPATATDVGRYTKLMKERKNLLPTVEKYREYVRVTAEAEDALALSGEDDREMADMAL